MSRLQQNIKNKLYCYRNRRVTNNDNDISPVTVTADALKSCVIVSNRTVWRVKYIKPLLYIFHH